MSSSLSVPRDKSQIVVRAKSAPGIQWLSGVALNAPSWAADLRRLSRGCGGTSIRRRIAAPSRGRSITPSTRSYEEACRSPDRARDGSSCRRRAIAVEVVQYSSKAIGYHR
jgi:hypothetical protein